jgi:hypothetical protein
VGLLIPNLDAGQSMPGACGTWFDADREQRVMWHATISGNPWAAYAGEAEELHPRVARH